LQTIDPRSGRRADAEEANVLDIARLLRAHADGYERRDRSSPDNSNELPPSQSSLPAYEIGLSIQRSFSTVRASSTRPSWVGHAARRRYGPGMLGFGRTDS